MDSIQETLRNALQPITHNLPQPITDLSISLLGRECHDSLLRDINIQDQECLKLAVSKALGLGIVAAASIVKVPQILKLLSSRSGSGVSVLSYLLETAAYVVSLAYNFRSGFPFSTYGETALIAAQNVVIAVLVLHFGGRASLAAAFVTGLAVAVTGLFSEGYVDMERLAVLQAGAGVVGVASKVPQILAIWSEGGTGQLSAFTVFNYLIGSLTRIFTTLQEVDDKLILYGFVAGFALNAVLAAQMLYYWNAPSPKAKGKQKQKPATYAQAAAATPPSGTPPAKKAPTRRRA